MADLCQGGQALLRGGSSLSPASGCAQLPELPGGLRTPGLAALRQGGSFCSSDPLPGASRRRQSG
eukprot:1623187-Alexandrium_andersonii.AAC.1